MYSVVNSVFLGFIKCLTILGVPVAPAHRAFNTVVSGKRLQWSVDVGGRGKPRGGFALATVLHYALHNGLLMFPQGLFV